MRLLSLASLKAQSMSVYGVDSRAPLYCLLVVLEATTGGLKTWKRIGVGIVDGSKVLSSSSQEFVLV